MRYQIVENKVIIADEPYKDWAITIQPAIEPKLARVTLALDKKTIGEAFAELNQSKSMATLYDVYVLKEFQRKGFATLLVREIFKQILEKFPIKSFGVRMVMKGTQTEGLLDNVGMGIISFKMGFTPQIDVEEFFSERNIIALEIILGKETSPAGYKISLKTPPFFVTMVILDERTSKPREESFYFRFVSAKRLKEWVLSRVAILGNVNYYLKEEDQDKFKQFLFI